MGAIPIIPEGPFAGLYIGSWHHLETLLGGGVAGKLSLVPKKDRNRFGVYMFEGDIQALKEQAKEMILRCPERWVFSVPKQAQTMIRKWCGLPSQPVTVKYRTLKSQISDLKKQLAEAEAKIRDLTS